MRGFPLVGYEVQQRQVSIDEHDTTTRLAAVNQWQPLPKDPMSGINGSGNGFTVTDPAVSVEALLPLPGVCSSGLLPGLRFQYRVRAFNSMGSSSWGEVSEAFITEYVTEEEGEERRRKERMKETHRASGGG